MALSASRCEARRSLRREPGTCAVPEPLAPGLSPGPSLAARWEALRLPHPPRSYSIGARQKGDAGRAGDRQQHARPPAECLRPAPPRPVGFTNPTPLRRRRLRRGAHRGLNLCGGPTPRSPRRARRRGQGPRLRGSAPRPRGQGLSKRALARRFAPITAPRPRSDRLKRCPLRWAGNASPDVSL